MLTNFSKTHFNWKGTTNLSQYYSFFYRRIKQQEVTQGTALGPLLLCLHK